MLCTTVPWHRKAKYIHAHVLRSLGEYGSLGREMVICHFRTTPSLHNSGYKLKEKKGTRFDSGCDCGGREVEGETDAIHITSVNVSTIPNVVVGSNMHSISIHIKPPNMLLIGSARLAKYLQGQKRAKAEQTLLIGDHGRLILDNHSSRRPYKERPINTISRTQGITTPQLGIYFSSEFVTRRKQRFKTCGVVNIDTYILDG